MNFFNLICAILGSIPIIIIWLYNIVIVIPPRKTAIVERFGLYNRTIRPGMHLIFYPFESLHTVSWTYYNQKNILKTMTQQIISFENVQMDVPSICCTTKNEIRVEIDVTLIYHISEPKQAVYETNDVLNLFYQCFKQSLCMAISEHDSMEIRKNMVSLGKIVVDYLNNDMKEKGIVCNKCIFQTIDFGEEIADANEAIYVTRQQQQMLDDKEEAQHKRDMKSLKRTQDKQKEELDVAYKKKEGELKLKQMEAQKEQEIRKLKWSLYTPEQIIQIKSIRAFEKIAKSNNKVIYAPSDYWTGGEKRISIVE